MNVFKEFRDFAVKGNVVDLAIGVIIGASFGKIVSSLVSEIIMPPLSFLLGKVDLTNKFLNLSGGDYAKLADAKAAGAITLNYGVFLNAVIDFVIVAFIIFLVVKKINAFKKKPQPAESTTKDCPFCLSIIPKAATRCGHCTSDLSK